ncbi:MAG: MFS transporter [Candidatus Doudnabacteria bacterium]|nr:MFS transporter [Candidatus Doudnabacteria bacterium]
MTLKLRLPHYFTFRLEQEVKDLYASAGVADVALAAMLIFEPIYMYQALGLSVVHILLFFAAVYFWYILLIPLGGFVTAKLGYRKALVVSVPFQILYWVSLIFAARYPVLLWIAPIFYALEKSFYWPGFHAIVARFANQGQVGREFSALTAIIQCAHILGPLVGGIIAQLAGGQYLLVVACAVYALSVIPLLLHKEQFQERSFSFRSVLRLYKKHPRYSLAYWGFGEELIALTVWPVFIYVAVAGYQDTGFVITIASILSAIISLYIGKLTDGHSKFSLLQLGTWLSALGWFVRPFLGGTQGALLADTSARVGKNLYFIPLSTVTYERAEAEDIMPYIVFFEQSLSVGKLAIALIAAALLLLTSSFVPIFILAGVFSLLYLYL